MTGLDVVVVRAAIDSEMARGRGLAAVGVVGDFIGAQDIIAVVNFGIAVKFVDVADLFPAGRRR